jgi:hypothetical protein
MRRRGSGSVWEWYESVFMKSPFIFRMDGNWDLGKAFTSGCQDL